VAHAPGIEAERGPSAGRAVIDSWLAGRSAMFAALLFAALLAAVPLATGVAISPRLTLLALAGLLAVALAIWRLDVALLLFVGTIPLEAAFQSSSSSITITKAAGALCFVSFVVHFMLMRRRMRLDQSHVVVGLLFVVALLASLGAQEVGTALTTTLRYASFALLYVMLSQLAGDRVFQRRLIWTLSIAATVSALIGIRDYLDGAYFATLPYENQNDFAFILATTIPLTCWLAVSAGWPARAVIACMTGLMVVGVVLSFSRGAAAALAVGIFVAVLSSRRRLVLGAGVVLVALVAVWGAIKADPQRFEESALVKHRVAGSNVTSRLDTWTAAATLAAERPALGVGPGNFQYHFFDATGRPPGTENLFVVHNAYLDVLTELGVAGFLLFLAYLGLAYSRARAVEHSGAGPPAYALSIRIALVVALAGAMFLSEQYVGPFWVIGALATGLWAESRASEASAASLEEAG
jgi:O-antigen ligase